MLVIMRRLGEVLRIDDEIIVKIIDINHKEVTLQIEHHQGSSSGHTIEQDSLKIPHATKVKIK
jgi:hypothetical protein